MSIFKKHKKLAIITSIITLILASFYIYALFLPGVWHQDTFLYHQPDGSFTGSNSYSYYTMNISPTDTGSIIIFSVNQTTKEYSVLLNESTDKVDIFEDGNSIFHGSVTYAQNQPLLIDDKHGLDFKITTSTSNDFFTIPKDSEQVPTPTQLYNWTFMQKLDTRGNPLMAVFILILTVFLILDIFYPTLFFHLRYALHVNGGEPSEFYLYCQKAGRIVNIVIIILCVILTFTVH